MAHHVDEIIRRQNAQELINKVEQIVLSLENWHKYVHRNYAERMDFLITIRLGSAEAEIKLQKKKKTIINFNYEAATHSQVHN